MLGEYVVCCLCARRMVSSFRSWSCRDILFNWDEDRLSTTEHFFFPDVTVLTGGGFPGVVLKRDWLNADCGGRRYV